MSPRALVLAIPIMLGIASASRTAYASSYALSWTTSPCVEQKALEGAVRERIGRDAFVPREEADVVLEGRELSPRAGRVRARVEQHARDGHVLGARDLEAASCAELTRAAAFVIVLVVDPDALMRDPEPVPEPPPVAVPAPPRAVEHRPPRAPRTPARRRAPSLVSVGAGLVFESGLLPGGDIGGALVLDVTPLPLPVRFEWRGSSHASLASPQGHAFTAFEQEWRACYLFGARAPLGLLACAGAAWAAIVPHTSDLREGDQSSKGVVGPLVAVGPRLRLGDYAVIAELSFFSPSPRYLFSFLDDAGQRRTLFEVDRFVGSATIGVTRSFW